MPMIIRQVKGFPGYLVGNDGSIWTKWRLRGKKVGRGAESYISTTLRPLKPILRKDGYQRVCLRKEGKAYDFLVHRLVLETFIGPCPDGMECLHMDGNKQNNSLDNLRWGTREENVQDSIRHGVFYNATIAAAKVNRGKQREFTEEHKSNMALSARRRHNKRRANINILRNQQPKE